MLSIATYVKQNCEGPMRPGLSVTDCDGIRHRSADGIMRLEKEDS